MIRSTKIKDDTGISLNEDNIPIKPQSRLELSVNPVDGSLLTAPLSLIINTATDALYNDLHSMATGEPITLYLPSAEDSQLPFTVKSEAMSSLSFQQRRHILASRIARHIQSFCHVSALVASNLPSSGTASKAAVVESQPNIYAMAQIPAENELSQITQVASQALEHVRRSWVSADTAQDALYFHHDSLWKMRSHPHDVLGSLEVLLKGRWTDLSKDIKLEDKFLDSVERLWNKEEAKERLVSAVRRKLVLGEVGMIKEPGNDICWKIILEKSGTAVRLVHGKPRVEGSVKVYPIEARVTVLSEQDPAPWTLLSVRSRTAVKTGESNHQLDLSREQMFSLHRICERAMNQEEIRVAKLGKDDTEVKLGECLVAQPLKRLLHITHVFSLSWQMEILSSQAEALRKVSWSSGKHDISERDYEGGISVAPVRFISEHERSRMATNQKIEVLGIMAIHFWQIDDRNGKPKLGHIFVPDSSANDTESFSSISSFSNYSLKRLTLEIIAVAGQGLKVRLSGGSERDEDSPNLKKHMQKLLSSLQDPFQLSSSDALLSAVVICAERRCRAVKDALESNRTSKLKSDVTGTGVLPSWLHLSLESGSISVAVQVSYNTKEPDTNRANTPVLLFRLGCDSRSGQFVATFPSAASLLRKLVCNDVSTSDIHLLRQAKGAASASLLVAEKRRASARTKDTTGRCVREAFLGLTRSLDILGRRVGVGGEWDDNDTSTSCALRQKSIIESCADVCVALEMCAGISAVFGIGALALGIAGSSNPILDISGGPISEDGPYHFIPVPPLSIVMNQQLVENNFNDTNGDISSVMKLERELSGIIASVSRDALTLHLLDITCQIESVIAVPTRLQCKTVPFKNTLCKNVEGLESFREAKRLKYSPDRETSAEIIPIIDEVNYLVNLLNATWEENYEL
mmetsp:Transcript_198/g.299  ORF Transcript_198/g.299 Transcript_198/m.299 type:complete len:918 (+) Transcript_198:153-2906(+)|eukprot:CAMPEP_0176481984 /NCGR_PEP_ID=MMETSP0200_2-20121128/3127_1 /TAXON_ID=947934 /ORGANISM="Chaetoceros sp., Strain GSL56" /LENGTH=917 /DNA_ID=CAMNT_0017878257 /DNA_START=62 /DNA_END=2815 /DNA_ORIENTATION=-